MRNKRWELYFILGTMHTGGRDPLQVLEGALKGGVTSFQLRENGKDALIGEKLNEFARQCQALCKEYKVPFIINEDVDLAVELGADGVHIEMQDRNVAATRSKIGPNVILGVSVNTAKAAFAAADEGASYIMIGPVYESELDTRPLVGVDLVRDVATQLPGLPIVGTGGISDKKGGAIIRSGAAGVVVDTAISRDDNPEEAARRIKGKVTLSLTGVEM